MGKFLLLLLFSSFLGLKVDAQDAVSAKMKVKYLVSYVSDTVKNTVLADTFCLRFNNEKSLFYEQSTYMTDSLKHYDIAKWSEAMSKILATPTSEIKGDATYYMLTDLEQSTYVYQDDISGSTYRYSDSLPFFDWKILPEYKTIDRWKCQKAEGTYMGRKYEAWFSADLSIKACPWKFYGLPGLIMEVYDTQHQYSFKMVDMQPCSGEMALFPTKHFKTSKDKFLKELMLYLKDPIAYQENHALIKIHFGSSGNELVTEMRNTSRHLPMELLK